jgi:hypothetical protein
MTKKHVPDHSHPDQADSQVMAQRFCDAIVEASQRGLVSTVEGSFRNQSALSVLPSGRCNEVE